MVIHTHVYHTDSLGRINKAEGQLFLNKMDRNTYQQNQVGKSVKASGDEGGHLIASALGGAGDRINLVPQSRTLNRKGWKRMENELKKELEAGKTVSVKIDITYPSNSSKRPSEFKVKARVDGEELEFEFKQ